MAQETAPALTSLETQPVAAGDLQDAYFHWTDQVVTVTGYPALFMSPSPWKDRVTLGATPEERTPELAACRFAEVPDGNLESAVAITVRGTVQGRSFSGRAGSPPKLDLRDCELVSSGDPLPSDSDPWTIGDTPIAIDALHEAAFGWQGQKVQVIGYYDGMTYSTANDTSRHDLRHDQGGDSVVGCNQLGDVQAPEAVLANRANVVVEGVIGEPAFDQVILEDCRFVQQ